MRSILKSNTDNMSKRSVLQRLLSFVLSVLLLCSTFPASALAEEPESGAPAVTEETTELVIEQEAPADEISFPDESTREPETLRFATPYLTLTAPRVEGQTIVPAALDPAQLGELPAVEDGELSLLEAWSFLDSNVPQMEAALTVLPLLADGESLILYGLSHVWLDKEGKPVPENGGSPLTSASLASPSGGSAPEGATLRFDFGSALTLPDLRVWGAVTLDRAELSGFALVKFIPDEIKRSEAAEAETEPPKAAQPIDGAPAELAEQSLRAQLGAGQLGAALPRKSAPLKQQNAPQGAVPGVDAYAIEEAVILSGLLPLGATVRAVPVTVSIPGQNVLAAYDITIFDAQGAVWQPAEAITVELDNQALTGKQLNVYHLADLTAEPEYIATVDAASGSVSFAAPSFSVYVVTEAPTITYELYLDKDFTVPYQFSELGTDGGEVETNRIIVKDGDVLKFPEQPTTVTDFRGWFDENEVEVLPGTVSGITESKTVKLYARNGDTAYVVLHERQMTGNDGVTTFFPVSSTAKVLLGVDGSGSLNLNEYEPKISYEDVNKRFIGWSTIESYNDNDRKLLNAEQAHANENIKDYDAETGVLTVTGLVNLYPVYEQVCFVKFYTGASGSGASYVATSGVVSGEALRNAEPKKDGETVTPVWNGYTFTGWTTEDEIKEADGVLNYNRLIIWPTTADKPIYFQNDDWANQVQEVSQDMTLYAVWTVAESANYQVVIWEQSVTDDVSADNKTYVYAGAYTALDQPGTLIDKTAEASAREAAGTIGLDLTGFRFAHGESDIVKPDGSTVLNLYFDREIYTVVVRPGEAYTGEVKFGGYAETDAKTGNLYAEDGRPIIYQFAGWQYKDPSISTALWPNGDGAGKLKVWKSSSLVTLSNYNSTSISAIREGTVGYASNSATKENIEGVELGRWERPEVVAVYGWFYADGDKEAYNGPAYKEMPPYVAVYEGLYEQPIPMNTALRYYYQPGRKTIRTFRAEGYLDNKTIYVERSEKPDSGQGKLTDAEKKIYYSGSTFDNDTLYIHSNGSGTVYYNNKDSGGLYYNRTAYLVGAQVTFPTSSEISTMAVEEITNLASYKFPTSMANKYYEEMKLQPQAYTTTNVFERSWGVLQSRETTLNLYGGISRTNNLSGNELTIFAESEGATTGSNIVGYYQATAPVSSAEDFIPWASYSDYLTAYKTKVVNGTASSFGGRAKTTNTVNVSELIGSDVVISGYTYTSYYTSGWVDEARGNITYGGDIKLLFEPKSVTVHFIDGSEELGSIEMKTGWSFDCFSKTGENPYAAYLSAWASGNRLAGEERDGKVFDGWYYDRAGTQPFDVSVPVTAEIELYAGWDYAWYIANVDPRGGVILGDTEMSTWFWRQAGSFINRYDNVARRYVEAADGAYYYYYNDRAANETYGEQGTVPRAAGYLEVSATAGGAGDWLDGTTWRAADGTIYCNIDKSVRYNGDYRNWKFVDWYDAATDLPYHFESPVTGDTTIYAAWKNLTMLTLEYYAGPEEDGYEVVDLEDNDLNVYGSLEDKSFLDTSEVVIQTVATNKNTPVQFHGWRMKLDDDTYDDAIYQQGERFVIDHRYADADGKITLVAVYDLLGTTSLRYDENYPAASHILSDLSASGTQERDMANNLLFNIELNDTLTLSKGKGFTRMGYTLIGWSTQADRDYEAFDPSSHEGVDFALGAQVVIDGADENVLYAVWKPALTIEVYTYENGDWEGQRTKLSGDSYVTNVEVGTSDPSAIESLYRSTKSYTIPSGYAYAFGKRDTTTVYALRYASAETGWEYQLSSGGEWQPLGEEALKVYFYRDPVTLPVKYVKVDGSGYAGVTTRSGAPTTESVSDGTPFKAVSSDLSDPTALVNNDGSTFSGYAYAIGVKDDSSKLFAMSATLQLRNSINGLEYSVDGTAWAAWSAADGEPAIYVVYYPAGKVYVTVVAEIIDPHGDTQKDIQFDYTVTTNTWQGTVQRGNGSGSNKRTYTVTNPTAPSTASTADEGSFTLRSGGESRVFTLMNGPVTRTVNNNTAQSFTATTQTLTVTQTSLGSGYTLTVSEDPSGSGSVTGTNDKTYEISSGTPSFDKGGYTNNGPDSVEYTLGVQSPTANTTASFTNIRKTCDITVKKVFSDQMADSTKTFVFHASLLDGGKELALDDFFILAENDGSTECTYILTGMPVGAALTITEEADTEIYQVLVKGSSEITGGALTGTAYKFTVPSNDASVTFTNTRYVCKITKNGLLQSYAGKDAVFTSLAGAFTALGNMTGDGYQVEMLVDNYDLGGKLIVPRKTFTLTTTGKMPADGKYAYQGEASTASINNGGLTTAGLFEVPAGSDMTLRNITIDGKSVGVTQPGALFRVFGALTLGEKATLQNGKAGEGTQRYSAGAVYITGSSAKLTVNGGTIQNCSSTTVGGAIYVSGGSFFMNDGLIDGCGTPTSNGGAVCVINGGMTITGGTIQNCTSNNGGAVYVSNGSMTITDGTIQNCTATSTGGAVYVMNSGSATFTGGTITGNKSAKGGAVYADTGGKLYFSGAPTITGNTMKNGATTANVYIDDSGKLIVNGDLTGGTVGVYGTAAYDESGEQFGTYNTETAPDGLSNFVNDITMKNATEYLTGADGGTDRVIWEIGVKVTPSQVFRDFEDMENPQISNDSAYTIRFTVNPTDGLKLKFYRESESHEEPVPVLVPKGTTVIMRINDGAYYWYQFDSAGSEAALSEFKSMGGGNSFVAPNSSFTAQFVVDFSKSPFDRTGTLTTEVGGVSGDVTLVDRATFGVKKNSADTSEADLTAAVDVTYAPSAGNVSIWDNRRMALVIKPKTNTSLPPDAELKVTIDGTAKTDVRSYGDTFIIPLGALDNYENIQITLESALFPAEATTYELAAELMASNSMAAGSPLNGTTVTNSAATLKLKTQAKPAPSAKIEAASQVVQPGKAFEFTVESLNTEAYTVAVAAYRKGESWDDLSAVETQSVADRYSVTPPEEGSYKIVVTVKDGATPIFEVPYYFLAVPADGAR